MWARAAVVLLVAASCGRSRHAGGPPPVAVIVDGTVVARVGLADLAARPEVAVISGVSPDRWARVTVDGSDRRTLVLDEFVRRYPDQDLRLYAADGRLAAGVFGRPRPDQPVHVRQALERPGPALIGAQRVTIVTTRDAAAPAVDAGAGPVAPTATLVISVDGHDQPIAGDRLVALALHDGHGHNRTGWELVDVIGLAGVERGRVRAVRVIGSDGTAALGGDQLAADGRSLVRTNRRGQLRFVRWTEDRKALEADLREVARIEIDTGAAAAAPVRPRRSPRRTRPGTSRPGR